MDERIRNAGHKIGIIGDKDSILGFKALGLDIFPAENSGEAEEVLKSLVRQGYGLIYITEQSAERIIDKIDQYNESVLPIITLIPSNQGSLGIAMKRVKSTVEKAVGADILFHERG